MQAQQEQIMASLEEMLSPYVGSTPVSLSRKAVTLLSKSEFAFERAAAKAAMKICPPVLYPVLDLAFMNMWNKEMQRPMFVPFRLYGSGTTCVHINKWGSELNAYYMEHTRLRNLTLPFSCKPKKGVKGGHSFEAQLSCIIPESTKENIKEARKRFKFKKSQMFMIVETSRCSQLVEGDPLIVGVKDNVCYLIDMFDATPIEEYVVQNKGDL